MVQIDVSKISSKGQVVIPARLRGRYKEGENRNRQEFKRRY